jgi:hypothetical protein
LQQILFELGKAAEERQTILSELRHIQRSIPTGAGTYAHTPVAERGVVEKRRLLSLAKPITTVMKGLIENMTAAQIEGRLANDAPGWVVSQPLVANKITETAQRLRDHPENTASQAELREISEAWVYSKWSTERKTKHLNQRKARDEGLITTLSSGVKRKRRKVNAIGNLPNVTNPVGLCDTAKAPDDNPPANREVQETAVDCPVIQSQIIPVSETEVRDLPGTQTILQQTMLPPPPPSIPPPPLSPPTPLPEPDQSSTAATLEPSQQPIIQQSQPDSSFLTDLRDNIPVPMSTRKPVKVVIEKEGQKTLKNKKALRQDMASSQTVVSVEKRASRAGAPQWGSTQFTREDLEEYDKAAEFLLRNEMHALKSLSKQNMNTAKIQEVQFDLPTLSHLSEE